VEVGVVNAFRGHGPALAPGLLATPMHKRRIQGPPKLPRRSFRPNRHPTEEIIPIRPVLKPMVDLVRPRGPLVAAGDALDELRRTVGMIPPPFRTAVRTRIQVVEETIVDRFILPVEESVRETFVDGYELGRLGHDTILCRVAESEEAVRGGKHLTPECGLEASEAEHCLGLPEASRADFEGVGVLPTGAWVRSGRAVGIGNRSGGCPQVVPHDPTGVRWLEIHPTIRQRVRP